MSVGLILKKVNPESSTEHRLMRMPLAMDWLISEFSNNYPACTGVFKWGIGEFIKVHEAV